MPSSVFARPYRALSVGILTTMTAIACEGMAVATILPTAATDLGGLDGYGWSFSAFMLTSLVGAIAAGQAADRRDALGPARIGFALFGAGLLVAGLSPSWPMLLLGRGLQGFGGGCLGAVAYLSVARGFPEALRPRLLALLSTAWVVPSLVGPALAGQVAEHASWRLVFLGLLPPVLAAAVIMLPAISYLPSPPADASAPARNRLPAAVRLAIGIGLVLLAAGMQELVFAMAVGSVGLVLAVPAMLTLLPRGTLRRRPGLPAAVAVRGLIAFGFFGCEALIPLGLSLVRDVPPSGVGLSLTAGALTWVAGTWIQDRLEARARARVNEEFQHGVAAVWSSRAWRVAFGLVLITVGIVSSATVILMADLPIGLALLGWAVAGLGMGLAYPGTTLVALATTAGQEGLAAASLQLAETVGIASGAGAAGAFVAAAVHLDRPLADGLLGGFVLTVAAALLALAPALNLERSQKASPYRLPPVTAEAAAAAQPEATAATSSLGYIAHR